MNRELYAVSPAMAQVANSFDAMVKGVGSYGR